MSSYGTLNAHGRAADVGVSMRALIGVARWALILVRRLIRVAAIATVVAVAVVLMLVFVQARIARAMLRAVS